MRWLTRRYEATPPVSPLSFDSSCLIRVWSCYNALPAPIREQADKVFALLKANPQHPSLHFRCALI